MNEEEDENVEVELVLSFDTDEEEFTRGFEAGMLWQRMSDDELRIEQYIRGDNTEMLMRMSEAKGYKYIADDLENDWYWIRLDKVM